jgi:hypothetical protein
MFLGGLATTFVAMAVWFSSLGPLDKVNQEVWKHPPHYVTVASISFMVAALLSVVPGFLGIRYGSDALSRIRSSAGFLTGSVRAQFGRLMGAIPTILVGIGLIITVFQQVGKLAGK